MINYILGWRIKRNTGIYAYYENKYTGRRKVNRISHYGVQPIDYQWLKIGNNE